MKRLANYLIAMVLMAFTFTSCEDVPNPFGQILPPSAGGDEVVVIEPAGSGTQADPYNVQAIIDIVSALDASTTLEKEYYVKGTVTNIPEGDKGISTSYNNASFYISDDTDGSNSFYIYRCLGLGGGDITDANFIKIGDEVVIHGTSWVNYQGNTPETTQKTAYVYSINGKTEGGGGGDTPTPTGDYGTKEAPLTVAKALEIINGLEDNGTVSPAFVKGKISKIQSFNDKYKSITYYISDDGTDNNSLQVYSGKGLDGTDFAAQTDLETGWTVVVTGELKKYVNANTGAVTLEINQSSQIVSIDKTTGGGGDTPSSDLGTKDAPITVAKALEAINAMDDSGETETEAFVKGKISKVQSYNDKYKSITYYISDDGTENKELQIYSGKNIGGADFTAATDLAAGDEVIVKGKLKKFMKNGEAIPEMNQPNEIISITKASGSGSDTGATSLDVDFKTNGQGEWVLANVKALPEGLDYVWAYDSKYGMKASAYVGGKRYETDNWLVSPTINLANGGTMTFKQALNYATSEYVKIMYTTTNGSGDVKSDEWKEASVDKWPEGNSWNFIESKATLPAGTVRVAFRYTSDSSKAATWEIESLSIK
jgi:hypothetical protein